MKAIKPNVFPNKIMINSQNSYYYISFLTNHIEKDIQNKTNYMHEQS